MLAGNIHGTSIHEGILSRKSRSSVLASAPLGTQTRHGMLVTREEQETCGRFISKEREGEVLSVRGNLAYQWGRGMQCNAGVSGIVVGVNRFNEFILASTRS